FDRRDASLARSLWIWGRVIAGRVVRRHGRAIRVRRIGEQGACIRVNVELFDLPGWISILLRQYLANFVIRMVAKETPGAAFCGGERREHQKSNRECAAFSTPACPFDAI